MRKGDGVASLQAADEAHLQECERGRDDDSQGDLRGQADTGGNASEAESEEDENVVQPGSDAAAHAYQQRPLPGGFV